MCDTVAITANGKMQLASYYNDHRMFHGLLLVQ